MQEHETPEYVQIHPTSSLSFDYIPKRYLTSTIHLTNVTSHLVAYKIKTNSPFSYLVKPCTGFIPPHGSTTAHITMQPTDYDHSTALNDKFLINACILSGKIYPPLGNELAVLRDIFKGVPDSQVQTHKLKVSLKFENAGSEEHLETRDTSGIESSPTKEDVSDHSDHGDKSFHTNLSEVLERPGSEKDNNELCLDEGQEVVGNGARIVKSQSMVEIKASSLLEKVRMLEKKNSSHFEGNNKQPLCSSTRRQEKLMEVEEHKKTIAEIIEERNTLREHLENIKKAANEKESAVKGTILKSRGEYQLWHILVVAVIGLILGALLR